MQSHKIEAPIYFTYYDIAPDLYKYERNLTPVLWNKKITVKGELILANIYQQSEDKQALLALAGSGRLYYSIFTENAKPENAIALCEFSPEELEKFKWEYYKIGSSNTFNKILQSLMDIPSYFMKNPLFLFGIMFNLFYIVAAFQDKKSASKSSNIAQNTLAYKAAIEVPFSEKEVIFSPSDEKQINFEKVKSLITFRQTRKEYVPFPRLFKQEELEYFAKEAMITDNLASFQYALSRGFKIFSKNANGEFNLLLTAKTNSFTIIEYVANTLKMDLNQFQTSFENSWILNALDYNHVELAQKLITWGVDIHYLLDNERFNLLHLFVIPFQHKISRHKRFSSVEKLLALGFNIDSPSVEGIPAVFLASLYNDTAMMGFLMDNHCKTTLHTSECLLSFSMHHSSFNTIKFLLKRGLDPNFHGSTALDKGVHHAIQFYSPIGSAVRRGEIAVIELLFKYGLKIETIDKIANPLFCETFIMQRQDIADYLVEKGVSVDEFARHWKKQMEQLGKKYWDYEDKIQAFLEKIEDNHDSKSDNNYVDALILVAIFAVIMRIIRNFYVAAREHLLSSMKVQEKLHLKKEAENRKNEKSNIKKNTTPIIHQAHDKIQKGTSEYKLLGNLQKTLSEVNACYQDSKKVKIQFVDINTCILLGERANAWEEDYKVIVELDEVCRGLQLKLNEAVKLLHRSAKKLKTVLSKNTQDYKEKSLKLLQDTQETLDAYAQEIEIAIKNVSTKKIKSYTNFLDLAQQQFILDTILKDNLKIKKHSNTCYSCIMEIEQFRIDIAKKMALKNTILPNKKEIISNKPTITTPLLEKTVTTPPKKPIIVTNDNKEPKTANKKRPVNNNDVCISSYSFFEPDKIKEDGRIQDINNLLGVMQKLTKFEEDAYLNNDPEISLFSAHYLLVKCSHLIANIASEEFGFKTIIIPNSSRLYNLRNNLIHYPRFCLHDVNIFNLLKQYFLLFKVPFKKLSKKGEGLTININSITSMSIFCFSNHKEERFINSFDNTSISIKNIHILCNKAVDLYHISVKLMEEGTYSDEDLLHCAINSLILQFRETMKKLDRFTLEKIKDYLPDFIKLGDIIAHYFTTGKKTLSYKDYLISPDSLFESIECVFNNHKAIKDALNTTSTIQFIGVQ